MFNKLLKFSRKNIFYLLSIIFLIGVSVLLFWHLNIFKQRLGEAIDNQSLYQVDLSDPQHSFSSLAKYFTDLAKNKGADYAYRVLRYSSLPPNIDLHLLGHEVGDILYSQKGVDGINVCTQDFRNACSHSIVVGLLLDKGEGALGKIADVCRRAPGGSGAYTMCFHGLGHGVLAYVGYDLKDGIKLCERVGTPEFNNREAIECIGGEIMEMIGGGFHNQQLWEKQSKIYLSDKNPLYPCDSDFMPVHAVSQCYIYLTPHLFDLVSANKGNPNPSEFKRAFSFCDKIIVADIQNRDACYGGFGKEFVALAQDRDIRKIDKMTSQQFKNIRDWCFLADNINGTRSCIVSALNSIYWGGENDRSASLAFCSVMISSSERDICYSSLIGAVFAYIKDVSYINSFCLELPREYFKNCSDRKSG